MSVNFAKADVADLREPRVPREQLSENGTQISSSTKNCRLRVVVRYVGSTPKKYFEESYFPAFVHLA